LCSVEQWVVFSADVALSQSAWDTGAPDGGIPGVVVAGVGAADSIGSPSSAAMRARTRPMGLPEMPAGFGFSFGCQA